MTTMTPQAPERIETEEETAAAAGALLLDVGMPGWAEYVETGTLDISSPIDCVCGQLFGSYSTGRKALGLTPDEAQAHGFMAPDTYRNARLVNAWAREIAARAA